MRIFLTFIFVVSKLTLILGQSKSNETELIIIGTKHDGNKTFNHRALYKTLVKLHPDIILWEQSIKFKRVFGLRTANFLKILKPGIEQLALQKYSRFNNKIQILPFDTTITSRKDYLKKIVVVKDVFYNRLYNAKKSISDSISYEDFAYKYNLYYSFIDTATLVKINQGYNFSSSSWLTISKYRHLANP